MKRYFTLGSISPTLNDLFKSKTFLLLEDQEVFVEINKCTRMPLLNGMRLNIWMEDGKPIMKTFPATVTEVWYVYKAPSQGECDCGDCDTRPTQVTLECPCGECDEPTTGIIYAAADFLTEAAELIQDRAKERDTDDERSMAKCVDAFNGLYGSSLTETQGWVFMGLLKLSRSQGGEYRRDDWSDLVAYSALAAECESKNK